MKRKTFSILFFIRTHRLLKNNEAPIYMRITLDGLRAETATGRSINPYFWNEAKGCVKGSSTTYKKLNFYLESLRHQVFDHQQELENKNKTVTAISLRDAFSGKDENASKTILQIYDDHNAKLKAAINKGVALLTWVRHNTSRNNLSDFIQHQFKKDDSFLSSIDHKFITDYQHYLMTEKNCAHNTTVKYLKNLGKVIRIALNNDWLKTNPFRNIRFSLQEVDKPFLNSDELETIIRKKFDIPRIDLVKDIFVFCCFTGLAYNDVKSLKREDIETDNKGNHWIRKQRQKTKQWSNIPLLPQATSILGKYSIYPECLKNNLLLPVLSNQKMNSYLKEIADLCGITKNLTMHCARHTFATTVTLANNISMESVSKMLGHASISMTKHYARILDSTIGKEMSGIASELDHSWPDHIDHQRSELITCCLGMYVNCKLTGEMWSINTAFAVDVKFIKN
jgi:site-specific recombinase XerD